MPDLITQLAQIRQRQGLDPIDPHTIQGFEPGSPPPPPFPGTFSEPTSTEDLEEPEPEMYVQRTEPAEVPGTEPPPRTAELPRLELCILDRTAGFRGQTVELDREEWGAVVLVVLGALRRTVDALRDEVRGPQASGVTPQEKAALQAPVKRGRGRPRKVQA